jgi:hypothetical protein
MKVADNCGLAELTRRGIRVASEMNSALRCSKIAEFLEVLVTLSTLLRGEMIARLAGAQAKYRDTLLFFTGSYL